MITVEIPGIAQNKMVIRIARIANCHFSNARRSLIESPFRAAKIAKFRGKQQDKFEIAEF